MKSLKIGLLLVLGLSFAACTQDSTNEVVESSNVVESVESSVVNEKTVTGQGNKGGNNIIAIDWSLKPTVNVVFESEYSLSEMLSLAIEDEYKAKNSYLAVMDKLGEVAPFNSIIESELSHIETLTEAINNKGYELPKDLMIVENVATDLTEALAFAIQAEVNNIAMYEHFLTLSSDPELNAIFVLLKTASTGHLESFMRASQKESSQ